MESDALLDADAQKEDLTASPNTNIGNTSINTPPKSNAQEADLEPAQNIKEQKKFFTVALRPRAQRQCLDTTPSKSWVATKAEEDREKEEKRLKELEAARIAAEERKEAEMKARRRSKTNFKLPSPGEVILPPLSQDWEKRVEHTMRMQLNRQIATSVAGTPISRRDMGTVLPGIGDDPIGWLNDEIVNAYMETIVKRGREIQGQKPTGRVETPKVAAMTSFFYQQLSDPKKGVHSVQRWAKRQGVNGDKLLDVDLLFIPVNTNYHWTLLVISGSGRALMYYDSLGGKGATVIAHAKEWLKQELGSSYNEDEWVVQDATSPRQDNGSDCGVFALTSAKLLIKKIDPLAYGPSHIPMQRRRIVAELLNGGLMDF
jgi:Ulp1 family protease